MKKFARVVLGLVFAAGSMVPFAARAQDESEGGGSLLDGLTGALKSYADSRSANQDITKAFQEELGRKPTSSELDLYRSYMDRDKWTSTDIRRDLRDRRSEMGDRSLERLMSSYDEASLAVQRVYREELRRDADENGLYTYRNCILNKGWTVDKVRADIRRSQEYKKLQRLSDSATDDMVRRAFQDSLNRSPIPEELARYRSKILDSGWSEEKLRSELRKQKDTRADTQRRRDEIINNAYMAVLGRGADESGLLTYRKLVGDKNWSQSQVEQDLRNSPEYKNKHKSSGSNKKKK